MKRWNAGRVPRLIPAHAGKTVAGDGCFDCHGAHPRSRGENTLIRADDKTFKGSSPLTRGKHERERDLLERFRLIPAHAGKTRLAVILPCELRAHPRSRGEND